ncbi:MAG: hypothetical protein GC160_15585 [Acidobacteria bacterium]|nr:hypothetical protein [Acidobacteriota bacterium]
MDDCDAVATDHAGNVYLACHVVSMDLPGVADAVFVPDDPMNAYIVKLSAALDAIEWGMLLAGSRYDGAFDIAVDGRGHVFVAGLTASPDFPVTANALQKRYGGGEGDAFFAEIDPEGKLLEVSFLGGGGTDQAFTLEIEDGTLWLGGATWSSDFPGVPNPLAERPGDADAFIARISSESEERVRSTLLGGREYEKVTGITAAEGDQLFAVGLTKSSDFPLVDSLQGVGGGAGNGFVAKLSKASLNVMFSTLVGGTGVDAVWGVDLLTDGRPVVAGSTNSTDLPTTEDAFQRTNGGADDAFLAVLAATGKSIDYCSYFGGSGDDSAAYDGRPIVVDPENRIWFVGQTVSENLPTRHALQAAPGGDSDGFIARLALDGTLDFASYLGGEGRDIAEGLSLSPTGRVWITGLTASNVLPFPLTLQRSHAGGRFDCFLVGLQLR